MSLPVWMQVIIALLAVFGVYSAVRLIGGTVFAVGHLTVTVRVQTKEDLELLEVLLREAQDAFFFERNPHPVVLFSSAVVGEGFPDEKLRALLKQFGAEYYVIPPEHFSI